MTNEQMTLHWIPVNLLGAPHHYTQAAHQYAEAFANKARAPLLDRIKELEAESQEQCRIIGMGSERELKLMAQIEALKASFGEPVAVIRSTPKFGFPLLEWLSAEHSFEAPIGSKLYALKEPT